MIDRLITEIEKKESPICLGLDTRFEYVPPSMIEKHGDVLEKAAKSIYRYNCALMDGLRDLVPSVKIQLACYEMYGVPGMRALQLTMEYARKLNLVVIADGKRSDIGSSAECYADAYMGITIIGEDQTRAFPADFLTVNPYLGSDGIEPFVRASEGFGTGAFVLVHTSNPSASELQDLRLADGKRVYERMMEKVDLWGSGLLGTKGYSEIGAVVGATYPKQAAELREHHPTVFFLLPGFGAQGAGAKELAACFDKRGRGGIINNSRQVLLAWQKEPENDPIGAARRIVSAMKDEILGAFEDQGIRFDAEGADYVG